MRKLSGSYTIEATFLMSVVIISMTLLIRFGYDRCRQVTGVMRLHQMVEIIRHEEDGKESLVVDSQAYRIGVKRYGNRVLGNIKGTGWSLEIESRAFEPEEFIRMLELLPKHNE